MHNRPRDLAPDVLLSAQDFTPFAGMKVRGWPVQTVLRGRVAFDRGTVRGVPGGRYIRRPVGMHFEEPVAAG